MVMVSAILQRTRINAKGLVEWPVNRRCWARLTVPIRARGQRNMQNGIGEDGGLATGARGYSRQIREVAKCAVTPGALTSVVCKLERQSKCSRCMTLRLLPTC